MKTPPGPDRGGARRAHLAARRRSARRPSLPRAAVRPARRGHDGRRMTDRRSTSRSSPACPARAGRGRRRARGPRLLRDRQPAARAHRQGRRAGPRTANADRASRSSSTCAPATSWTTSAPRCDELRQQRRPHPRPVPRRQRRRAGAPLRGEPPPPPALRLADASRDGIARERALLEAAQGRGRPRASTPRTSTCTSCATGSASCSATTTPAAGALQISVVSFGYKHGLPLDVDLVFDCRFLPNPHWVEELRPADRHSTTPVRRLRARPARGRPVPRRARRPVRAAAARVTSGKASRTSRSAVGCTGGRHRSVVDRRAAGRAILAELRVSHGPVHHRDVDRAADAAPRSSRSAAGTGSPSRCAAARRYAGELTAVVSVADDGGSSGRLRRDLDVLPRPATCARCLVALAAPTDRWPAAFEHRFAAGELARPPARQPDARRAQPRRSATSVAALDEAGRLLGTAGRVRARHRRAGRPEGRGRRRRRSRARSRSSRPPRSASATSSSSPHDAPGHARRARRDRRAPTRSCSPPGRSTRASCRCSASPASGAAVAADPRAGGAGLQPATAAARDDRPRRHRPPAGRARPRGPGRRVPRTSATAALAVDETPHPGLGGPAGGRPRWPGRPGWPTIPADWRPRSRLCCSPGLTRGLRRISMAVRVGINGFGRIGRSFTRALLARGAEARGRAGGGERPVRRRRTRWRSCSSTTRWAARCANEIKADDDGFSIDGQRGHQARGARPGRDPVGRPRRRRRDRVDRAVHRPGEGRRAPRGRRQAGRHLGAQRRRRRHDLHRRQRRGLRPRRAHRHLERVVHHELPRAHGQGARTTRFGIEQGFITTVHAYTSDQRSRTRRTATPLGQARPAPHARPRRCRSSRASTGAAKAIGAGAARRSRASSTACRCGCRRPTGSITDLVVEAAPRRRPSTRSTTAFTEAAQRPQLPRRARVQRRAAGVGRHRRQPGVVHLLGARHDGERARWSRCSAGTTTSGATRTASSTSSSSSAPGERWSNLSRSSRTSRLEPDACACCSASTSTCRSATARSRTTCASPPRCPRSTGCSSAHVRVVCCCAPRPARRASPTRPTRWRPVAARLGELLGIDGAAQRRGRGRRSRRGAGRAARAGRRACCSRTCASIPARRPTTPRSRPSLTASSATCTSTTRSAPRTGRTRRSSGRRGVLPSRGRPAPRPRGRGARRPARRDPSTAVRRGARRRQGRATSSA